MSARSYTAPLVALALPALVLALVAWRYSAPAPRPAASTPASAFSGERALAQLRALLGSTPRPHPVGSAESAAVRTRLVARLRALGLAPRV
ncbi:MAG: hypothetical protein KC503_12485, partial [Myxococcales bacterium]|nr:hypothetical protein [Myxococcales bacterium]